MFGGSKEEQGRGGRRGVAKEVWNFHFGFWFSVHVREEGKKKEDSRRK